MVNVWGGECLGGERLTIVPEQIVSVDVQLFQKKYDFNIFSHTQRVLDKKKTFSQRDLSL